LSAVARGAAGDRVVVGLSALPVSDDGRESGLFAFMIKALSGKFE